MGEPRGGGEEHAHSGMQQPLSMGQGGRSSTADGAPLRCCADAAHGHVLADPVSTDHMHHHKTPVLPGLACSAIPAAHY